MVSKTTIKVEIYNLLEDYPETLRFINGLSEFGDLLFFGGSIRDYYLYNEYKKMPRDFDIAVKLHCKTEKTFESFVEKYNYKKNRFGGYKVNIENIEFDLWNLENTWAFRENKLLAEEKILQSPSF